MPMIPTGIMPAGVSIPQNLPRPGGMPGAQRLMPISPIEGGGSGTGSQLRDPSIGAGPPVEASQQNTAATAQRALEQNVGAAPNGGAPSSMESMIARASGRTNGFGYGR